MSNFQLLKKEITEEIFQVIKMSQGITLKKLCKQTDFTKPKLKFELKKLEQKNLIFSAEIVMKKPSKNQRSIISSTQLAYYAT